MRKSPVFALGIILTLVQHASQAQTRNDDRVVSWGSPCGYNCRVVVLTETGIHLTNTRSTLRGVATAGLLVKSGTSGAFGAALTWSIDEEQIIGPELRYRRWFDSTHSVDVGLGLTMWREFEESGQANPYLLVKYHPAPWMGIVLRTDYRRTGKQRVVYSPSGTVITREYRSRVYWAGGIEVDGPAGFIIQAAGLLLVVIAIGGQ